MRTNDHDLNWARHLEKPTTADMARLRLLARQSVLPAHRAAFERVLATFQGERPAPSAQPQRPPLAPPLNPDLIERRFAAAIRRSRPGLGRDAVEHRAQLVAKRVTARDAR